MRALLLSGYELGHPPLSLTWPLAFLRQAGHEAAGVDLAVQALPEPAAAEADLIAIAAPMHTALRLGVEAARRVRSLNPRAHICFYGLYAWLNADGLLDGVADSVIGGEIEGPLLELAGALARGGDPAAAAGVSTRGRRAAPALARQAFPLPDRSSLPGLDHYARYRHNGHTAPAGYLEASRGCRHTCRHCPITPVYNGRFFVVPAEVVLADAAQQVAAGARHLTFGDPDFMNGPGHSLRVARELHRRFPAVTWDATIKVEHILKHAALFPALADLGCTFVVSAIESISDRVLTNLHKGHTAADVDRALRIVDAAGLALHPTLVAFTPWTTADDYGALLEFVRSRGLIHHVPPVQWSIRLLIPPGSPLAHAPDAGEWLGELDPAAFSFRWAHPDPRMDELHAQVAVLAAESAEAGVSDEQTFEAIRELAYAALGQPVPSGAVGPQRPAPPRLTEDWFC